MFRGRFSLSRLRSAFGGEVSQERLTFALAFGLAHWALLVLLQCANFGRSLLPIEQGAHPVMAFAAALPRMQGQNVIAALLVTLIAAAASTSEWKRRCFFAGYAIISGILLLDQVCYRYFFDRFRPSQSDGIQTIDPRLMLSSLGGSIDGWFALTAATLVLLLFGLARQMTRSVPEAMRLPSAWPAFFLAPLALWTVGAEVERYPNLHIHPLYPAFEEAFSRKIETTLGRSNGRGQNSPPELRSSGPASIDPRLPRTIAKMRRQNAKPNVVLVVLESVGALQLLGPGGLPDKTITPNLAALAGQGVIFDSIYSVFPATVRTHAALHTGGYHPTWSSIYDLFGKPYTGVTLPRAFAKEGWKTSLFSSERLDGEAMDRFIEQLGFDKTYDFATDRANHKRGKILSTWGAREEHTLGLIAPWVAEQAASRQPFFLTYLTVATHHPYAAPPEAPKLFHGRDDISRYRNALHYTDAAIGRLLEILEEAGLRENTLIAITGDHGQAFGDRHPHNFAHRNFLYEENIRSFLILSHPALTGPIVSDRLGSTGDILPTLLAFPGTKHPEVAGRDLTALRLEPRMACFHKNAFPEQWGLRDRSWKFIETIRDRKAELYDLATDPTEQVNLAGQHPEQIQRYSALCEQWFLASDSQFTSRIAGHTSVGKEILDAKDLRTPGPKTLATGYRLKGDLGPFTEFTRVHPSRPPIAWTYWTVYEHDTPVIYDWISPSGAVFSTPATIQNLSSTKDIDYPGPLPMESGEWQIAIRRGRETLLKSRFEVTADAPQDLFDQGM